MNVKPQDLTVRAIGTLSGVILPKATLAHLGVERGETLIATQVPGGVLLVAAELRLGRIMADADEYMLAYNATFRELAR